MTSPNGGESWETGQTKTITWNSSNTGSSVVVDLYKGGQLSSTIASSISNNGSYSWAIPSSLTEGTDYKIKITDSQNNATSDLSNANFTIEGPPLSPPTGITATIQVGSGVTLTWSANSESDLVGYKVYKSCVGGSGTDHVASIAKESARSYSCTGTGCCPTIQGEYVAIKLWVSAYDDAGEESAKKECRNGGSCPPEASPSSCEARSNAEHGWCCQKCPVGTHTTGFLQYID